MMNESLRLSLKCIPLRTIRKSITLTHGVGDDSDVSV